MPREVGTVLPGHGGFFGHAPDAQDWLGSSQGCGEGHDSRAAGSATGPSLKLTVR
jgi:hypothetical protein